jgi:hypothetical protein
VGGVDGTDLRGSKRERLVNDCGAVTEVNDETVDECQINKFTGL